nr:peptidoglycan DD-metalloendopeptidase family protein [uncultured Gemmiger sp.]
MKSSQLDEKPTSKKSGSRKKHRGPGKLALWLDDVRCGLTVRSWHRSTKKKARRARMANMVRRLPHATIIGDALYLIGFWVEYAMICAVRGVEKTVRVVAAHAGQLILTIARPFLLGFITLLEDLTEPFRRMHSGLKHIGELEEALPDESARQIRKEKMRYFRRGALRYFPVVLNALSYLLPVAAAVGLFYVVKTGLGYDYVLNVIVDGESVGYVANEQVFENARDDVQGRIDTAKSVMQSNGGSVSEGQWNISPTYTLAINNETMTESEVANAILGASSDEIGEGTAVYVDGELKFVINDGDHLRSYLESVKQPYEDTSDPNRRVSFVHDISLVDGIYLLDSIMPYSDVIAAMNEGGGPMTYTAGADETVQTVVDNTGVSWDSLASMNPQLTSLDQELEEGEQITTGVSSPELLKVEVIERQSYTVEVPFDTVTSESDEYDFGKTVVDSPGENGIQELTQDLVYVDGVLTETNIVKVDTLKEPVTEYVTKGTRLKSGMTATYGSGEWMWPVPGYTYVSRWMSSYHKGADICAPYGTPIYAADSGVVVTAGYHYSYGNYVIIDHGNGWRTLYGHMSSLGCSVGQAVQRGQVIGYVGSTGNSTGNHCHFEMYQNGTLVSARNFFGNM